MTQQGREELKARRGKSPRGAVLEGPPLCVQAAHGVRDRKGSQGVKSVYESKLFKCFWVFELSYVGFRPVEVVAPAAMHPVWVVVQLPLCCRLRLSCAC